MLFDVEKDSEDIFVYCLAYHFSHCQDRVYFWSIPTELELVCTTNRWSNNTGRNLSASTFFNQFSIIRRRQIGQYDVESDSSLLVSFNMARIESIFQMPRKEHSADMR